MFPCLVEKKKFILSTWKMQMPMKWPACFPPLLGVLIQAHRAEAAEGDAVLREDVALPIAPIGVGAII
jgi:hypothetical protein